MWGFLVVLFVHDLFSRFLLWIFQRTANFPFSLLSVVTLLMFTAEAGWLGQNQEGVCWRASQRLLARLCQAEAGTSLQRTSPVRGLPV